MLVGVPMLLMAGLVAVLVTLGATQLVPVVAQLALVVPQGDPLRVDRRAILRKRRAVARNAGGVAASFVAAKLAKVGPLLRLGAIERGTVRADGLDVRADFIPILAQVFALGRIGAGGCEREHG
jgi:hypothetical protein